MKLNQYPTRAICLGLLALFGILYGCKTDELDTISTSSEEKQTGVSNVTLNVHPGVANTQRSLEWLRLRWERDTANPTTAFRKPLFDKSVMSYINTHKYSKYSHPDSASKYPKFTVFIKASFINEDERAIKGDVMLAYAHALAWAVTGGKHHATYAKNILNAYGYRFDNLQVEQGTGVRGLGLESSWLAPTFVAAAEIIRDYKRANTVSAGWSSADATQFNALLFKFNKHIHQQIILADTTQLGIRQTHNSNWGTSAGFAVMSMGVYLSRTDMYDTGYKFLLRRLTRVNNDINSTADDTDLIKKVNGTNGKGRGYVSDNKHQTECDHFQYTLTAVAYGAEIARNHGNSFLYEYSNKLLLAGYNYQYLARNEIDQDVLDKRTCYSNNRLWPGVEVANRYYNPTSDETLNIAKLRAPNTSSPNTVVDDFTFWGFTTFTNFKVPLNP